MSLHIKLTCNEIKISFNKFHHTIQLITHTCEKIRNKNYKKMFSLHPDGANISKVYFIKFDFQTRLQSYSVITY